MPAKGDAVLVIARCPSVEYGADGKVAARCPTRVRVEGVLVARWSRGQDRLVPAVALSLLPLSRLRRDTWAGTPATNGPITLADVETRTITADEVGRSYTGLASCLACYQPLVWRAVKVTFNAATVCDAACTQATGDTCRCSCGGANHGTD